MLEQRLGCWMPKIPSRLEKEGRGECEGGAGTNLVRVFRLLVRALQKITEAHRVPVHKFDEISFELFWLL